MVDGDDTYDAALSAEMVSLDRRTLCYGLSSTMVTATRIVEAAASYRPRPPLR